MKKIMLSFVLGILVLGFAAAAISGMAVSVSEKETKAFSFNDRNYAVDVSESSTGADLAINGETVEDVQVGDTIMVDGAEVEVTGVRAPWLFRNGYKVDLKVKESGGSSFNSLDYFRIKVYENLSVCTEPIKGSMAYLEGSLEDMLVVCMKVSRGNLSFYNWETLDHNAEQMPTDQNKVCACQSVPGAPYFYITCSSSSCETCCGDVYTGSTGKKFEE